MSKKTQINNLRNAILRRDDEISKDPYIVSKILEMYGMEQYRTVVENRILDADVPDYFYEEHVTLNFIDGEIWLDAAGLEYYKDILTGYIGRDEYEIFLDMVNGSESVRNLENIMLKHYKDKSIIELFNIIVDHKKYLKTHPEETSLIMQYCICAMFGRTLPVRGYYKLKALCVKLYARILFLRTMKVIKLIEEGGR